MTENHDDCQQRRDGVSRLGQRVAELRLAIMFLTRLPVGHIDPLPRFADAMWAYPIAGAIHGTIMGLVFMAASWADLAA
ncbi:MAG: adenosylcobinamide-GDP ribazoletransferase, partial [Pseudomonadota bacterium]